MEVLMLTSSRVAVTTEVKDNLEHLMNEAGSI